MKQKIAVDIDDVLFDFNRALIEFYNLEYHTSFKKEDFFTYELEKVFGITPEEKTKRMISFYESPYFFNLKPVKGAQEAMEFLNKENEVIVATSRPSFLTEQTEKSLEKFFDKTYSGIFYSEGYHQLKGKTKAEICISQKVSFLIDDCLKYAVECSLNGIPVLLMNAPWNQRDLEGTLIFRRDNWKEILSKIRKKELTGRLK